MTSDDPNAEKKQPPTEVESEAIIMEEKIETTTKRTEALPDMKTLTVEELYDKDKYDMSTMEPGDVFTLLQ